MDKFLIFTDFVSIFTQEISRKCLPLRHKCRHRRSNETVKDESECLEISVVRNIEANNFS